MLWVGATWSLVLWDYRGAGGVGGGRGGRLWQSAHGAAVSDEDCVGGSAGLLSGCRSHVFRFLLSPGFFSAAGLWRDRQVWKRPSARGLRCSGVSFRRMRCSLGLSRLWVCAHQHPATLCSYCSVAQSCLTLFDPMDCSPPGSSVHKDFPGKNSGVACHSLIQGIFPTQGSNLHLLYWQADS